MPSRVLPESWMRRKGPSGAKSPKTLKKILLFYQTVFIFTTLTHSEYIVLITEMPRKNESSLKVRADPIRLNTNLGYYTNFVNLLDLAAVAVPAGFRSTGLPFGISFIGPAFSDESLLALADRYHRAASSRSTADVPSENLRRPPQRRHWRLFRQEGSLQDGEKKLALLPVSR